MRIKFSALGKILFFCCLFWTTQASGQGLQISLDIFAPNPPPDNCELGSICLNCDGSFTFTGTGVATHIDVGYFPAGGGDYEFNGLCNAYQAFYNNQPDQYCNQTWSFPPGTVTVDNQATIQFQYYDTDFSDRVGCNGMEDEVHIVDLSALLASLRDDCREEPACPEGLTTMGGVEGFVDAFVADSDELITFDFNTFWIPDQLIVHVNCEEVLNSGIYSTNPVAPFQFNSLNSNCGVGGYINGMGAHFFDGIQVNAGDNVTIQVIGDNCTISNTQWQLFVGCGHRKPALYQFGSAEELGSFETIDHSFAVYPNPARDLLTYSLAPSEIPYQVTIYNVEGKVMHVTESTGGVSELSVEDYASGMYMIQAVRDGEVMVQRIEVLK